MICNTNYFNNTFFPYFVNEWNKLDPVLRELDLFKKFLLRFLHPKSMPVHGVMDPLDLKLLTRLKESILIILENTNIVIILAIS